jgi:hypothetical protein
MMDDGGFVLMSPARSGRHDRGGPVSPLQGGTGRELDNDRILLSESRSKPPLAGFFRRRQMDYEIIRSAGRTRAWRSPGGQSPRAGALPLLSADGEGFSGPARDWVARAAARQAERREGPQERSRRRGRPSSPGKGELPPRAPNFQRMMGVCHAGITTPGPGRASAAAAQKTA